MIVDKRAALKIILPSADITDRIFKIKNEKPEDLKVVLPSPTNVTDSKNKIEKPKV